MLNLARLVDHWGLDLWRHETPDGRCLRRANTFAALQAISAFDFPAASAPIEGMSTSVGGRQGKNGTFGTPCQVEPVAVVLAATRRLA